MFEHDESCTGKTSRSRLQAILARYSPRVAAVHVEPLGNRGGFSGAGIWRVVTSQGDFALRQWPRPGLSDARILGLHRLMEHLLREGMSFVAVPIPGSDGLTVQQEGGFNWQLEPWMAGRADFHANPSPDRLRAAMAALARWHLAAARFEPAPNSVQWFSSPHPAPSFAVAERLTVLHRADAAIDQVHARLSAAPASPLRDTTARILELFRRSRVRIAGELQQIRDVNVPLQPCLRDVWHDHLLFEGDRISGLIDPSACRTESVAGDLSRLIGSLVGDDPQQWESALEAYDRVRSLSPGERLLIPVLDRSGVLLSGWTWLDWLHLQRRGFPDPAAVRNRLEVIHRRMQRLVD